MIIDRTTRGRAGRILLWLGVALLAVFVALMTFEKFFGNRVRIVTDVNLVDELASATFIDDNTKPDPKTWIQWRGERRDGVTTAPDLLTDWPDGGPKRLWSITGGDGYSSFAVSGDSVYSMIGFDDREAVICWDIVDGTERWRHAYAPNATFDYGGPRATPTLDGDRRLYTVSSAGVLMCLDTKDGSVIWQSDLLQELAAVAPRWGFAFSPLVQGDRVFATPGGKKGRCLAAFTKDKGKLLWASQDDPAGYSSPVAATIDGTIQVLFFTGRRLLGVTPDDGKLLWDFVWDTEFQVNAATPEVIHARSGNHEVTYVFISSGYGKGCALVKVSAENGKFAAQAVYESNELRCHFGSPVRNGEYMYGFDEKEDLTCLAIRTGRAVWRQRGFSKGSLLRVDDQLIALGENGKLALIDATPYGYQEHAAFRPFRDRCWTMPVLADGRLFLRDRKRVMCLDLRKP